MVFQSLAAAWILAAGMVGVSAKDDNKAEQGFVSLFDGKTLNGWIDQSNGYKVEDGVITCSPKARNLFTEKEYANFVLRFDFKLDPGANSGVGMRAPLQGDAAYVGMESQILDDGAAQYKTLQKYQYHGSIYGIIPAKRGYLKPTGEWNSEEITLNGRKIKVVLNGEVILDGDLDQASTPKTLDGKDHPGLKRTSGHLGFLGHGPGVDLRKIRIKDLGD